MGFSSTCIGSDGIEYLGSHLDAAGKTGEVSAGDVIGYVGTSGNAAGTTPHLHFGMYREGRRDQPPPDPGFERLLSQPTATQTITSRR